MPQQVALRTYRKGALTKVGGEIVDAQYGQGDLKIKDYHSVNANTIYIP